MEYHTAMADLLGLSHLQKQTQRLCCCASDSLALRRPSQQILIISGVCCANMTTSDPEARGPPITHMDNWHAAFR